jgi:hypothetical protein
MALATSIMPTGRFINRDDLVQFNSRQFLVERTVAIIASHCANHRNSLHDRFRSQSSHERMRAEVSGENS